MLHTLDIGDELTAKAVVLRPLGEDRRDHHRTGVDQRHHPPHLHDPNRNPADTHPLLRRQAVPV